MKSYLAVIALLALLCTLKADAAEEKTADVIQDDFVKCLEAILTDAKFKDDKTNCGKDADWKACGKDFMKELGEQMAEDEEDEDEKDEDEEDEDEESCESLEEPMKMMFEGIVGSEIDSKDLYCESSFDALLQGIIEGCEEANGVGYKGFGFVAITLCLVAFNWLGFGN